MTHTSPCIRWQRRAAALLLALSTTLVGAFDLQGHRGARGLAPENSLAGFEVALQHRVTTLELDIAITRDGVLVIHHDLTLNPDLTRDAQGRWLDKPSVPIHTLTWAELQAYDVGRVKPGSRYASNHPDQQPIDGTRIPRLADLFDLVKRGGHDQVRFAIETKINPLLPESTLAPEPFAEAVVAEIRKAGMQHRSQILSFDWRTLAHVQRIAPEMATVYITAQQRWLDNVGAGRSEPSPWTAGLRYSEHGSVPRLVKAAGGKLWSAYFGDLDRTKVQEAQTLGLKVLTWTVNDAATMHRMLDLGVDGLVTDRPDIAREVLRERRIDPR